MTLGTHAIVGGSIAVLAPVNPAVAFFLGFVSHFLLDAIPHYDYPLLSLEQSKENKLSARMNFGRLFLIDLARIGGDVFIGFAVLFLCFGSNPAFFWIIIAGAIGAIIPDALQFAYFKLRTAPLTHLQRFHIFIHADSDLNHRPLFGIFCQVIVASVFISLSLL